MKIAVLSGKGGTGKTFVSVNLTAVFEKWDPIYIDCDVEEPNGYHFWDIGEGETHSVGVKVPEVIPSLCNGCRVCTDFCRFNALAYAGGELKIFEDLCHSCGGCVLLCPQKALREKERIIGEIKSGRDGAVKVAYGILHPGNSTGMPIITELWERSEKEEVLIADCPPGTGCSAIECVKRADYCLLVAEESLFGLHNLRMVHSLVQLLDKPFSVVINKVMPGYEEVRKYCRNNNITVLKSIPYDNVLKQLNSEGRIAVRENEKYRHEFSQLLEYLLKEAGYETAFGT